MYKNSSLILLVLFLFCSCKTVQKKGPVVQQEPIEVDRQDSSVVVKAGKIYKAGEVNRFLLGDNYRDVWTAPVEVPMINIETKKGGLEILGEGGGMQTKSLKLKAANDKLYSLRSIQKDPSPALPKMLRSTVAQDVIQDLISASNPYGAFILPGMAEAAGIYHTNPELYYLPDTPELGEYQDEFGGMLMMLEEDADEDWSDYEDFGFTENAVSTSTVREDLMEDNDNQVDQRAVLRARLFDMWVGDWDRHEGNWRWAELDKDDLFEEDKKGNLYRPIPEDRDNVFFQFDGVFPWILSRKWAIRKFQSFEEEVRDMKGLNYQARNFDRRFLTELSREEWHGIADTLQRRLTNEVIKTAVNQWPDTINDLRGEEYIHKLKVRREKLKEWADEYYEILAKEVDIHGSDKHEYFLVERLDDERTRVTMYKSNDDGGKEKILYQRTFYTDETDEVRLYGFGNKDFFEVTGEVDESIVVRIIGGDGEDEITDKSYVRGRAKKTKVYDIKEDTDLNPSEETRDFTSKSLDANRYDYDYFEYDFLAPQVFLGYNQDDGIFIGGGVLIKTNDFRKYDFSTQQRLVANYAFHTGAYNIIYEGSFREVFKKLDVDVDLLARAPDFVSNYFGLGNDTERIIENEEFYEYRKIEANLDVGFKLRFGENNFLKFGPSYRFMNVLREADNFLVTPLADVAQDAFDETHYAGMLFESELAHIDNKHYPTGGVRWNLTSGWFHGLYGEKRDYSRIQSDLTLYYTPFKTQNIPVTFAFRFGGASNIGDFFFFQANTLGGNQGFGRPGNLRGYVRDRFSGRSALYQNTEARISLAKFRFYILPVRIGLIGLMDHGRVFTDLEESDEWHSGYGGGLFIQPVDKWVLTATYATSEENGLWYVNLGFNF
ncbi:MAG: BamA/TamA family outer membrane protein [Candidatus Cyclobacteriaceae bacterium M2_1C_046]